MCIPMYSQTRLRCKTASKKRFRGVQAHATLSALTLFSVVVHGPPEKNSQEIRREDGSADDHPRHGGPRPGRPFAQSRLESSLAVHSASVQVDHRELIDARWTKVGRRPDLLLRRSAVISTCNCTPLPLTTHSTAFNPSPTSLCLRRTWCISSACSTTGTRAVCMIRLGRFRFLVTLVSLAQDQLGDLLRT